MNGILYFSSTGNSLFVAQQAQKKLSGEIARATGMLNNERFTSKAPAEKVAEERAKLEKYTQMLAQVQERLAQLK